MHFWHFDKLILHILTYKVDIEMSFLFSVCTFVYEESTFYTEDFFFVNNVRAYCMLYSSKSL